MVSNGGQTLKKMTVHNCNVLYLKRSLIQITFSSSPGRFRLGCETLSPLDEGELNVLCGTLCTFNVFSLKKTKQQRMYLVETTGKQCHEHLGFLSWCTNRKPSVDQLTQIEREQSAISWETLQLHQLPSQSVSHYNRIYMDCIRLPFYKSVSAIRSCGSYHWVDILLNCASVRGLSL